MSPLEEQASSVSALGQKLTIEIDSMNQLLEEWLKCDQANEDNHWMYYDCQNMIDELEQKLNMYHEQVVEVELLESIQENGDITYN